MDGQVEVLKYEKARKAEWDNFMENSKNPLFMFYRDYMEYHENRFTDHSLMFYCKGKLAALLPGSIHGDELVSHGGLTYGGFITDSHMHQKLMDQCFAVLEDYGRSNGIRRIRYKVIPHIYHLQPAEEDKYALCLNNAVLSKMEPSTVINLQEPLKMAKLRERQIKRAVKEKIDVVVLETSDGYCRFMGMQNDVLKERHGVEAVHTGKELYMLHSRFPDHIHLYAAMREEQLLGGTIIFEYPAAVHTQYLCAGSEARKAGALDLVISVVMERYRNTKKWLDFGISSEQNGTWLNEGLIAQKEGFGGRTNTYETWVWEL